MIDTKKRGEMVTIVRDEYRISNRDGTDWVYIRADEIGELLAQLQAVLGAKPAPPRATCMHCKREVSSIIDGVRLCEVHYHNLHGSKGW